MTKRKLKPLTATQKRVLRQVAGMMVMSDLDQKVLPGVWENFKKRMSREERQVHRFLESAKKEYCRRAADVMDQEQAEAKKQPKQTPPETP
jgi:hypothetical protein